MHNSIFSMYKFLDKSSYTMSTTKLYTTCRTYIYLWISRGVQIEKKQGNTRIGQPEVSKEPKVILVIDRDFLDFKGDF